ncbi:MAG: hypothetical protein ACKKL4_01710 [Patescibacteria group bacterium]
MFKRVAIVFTLLFAHSALAQVSAGIPVAISSDKINLDSPVVAVSGATGTAIYGGLISASSTSTTSPAEMTATSSASVKATSSVAIGSGALDTSSTTTVSTTTYVDETEEDTETSPASVKTIQKAEVREHKLFDLVYGGFERFVFITLGWR